MGVNWTSVQAGLAGVDQIMGNLCVPIVIVMAMMIGLEFIRRGLSRISDDYGDGDDDDEGADGDDDWR